MRAGMIGVLAIMVIAAAWSDWRTRRIPNWITGPGALGGFILQAWYGGISGALVSLAGAGLGLAIFAGLYLLGGMGAGDVKLFGAVGAFVGPEALLSVFVITALLGGIAAVLLAIVRRQLKKTLARTGELMIDMSRMRWRRVKSATAAAGSDSLRLPYGVIIAGGTLLSIAVLR